MTRHSIIDSFTGKYAFFCCLLAALFLLPAPDAALGAGYTGKVNEGVFGLNVRSGPSVRNQIVTVIHSGQRFTAQDEQDGWYSITLPDGTAGWVSGKYITVTSAGAELKLLTPADGSSISGSSVTLTWQSDQDPQCYRVVVKDAATGTGDTHYLPTAASQTLQNLEKGKTYSWMVAAMMDGTLSDYTPAWTFTVGAPQTVQECPVIESAHVVSALVGSASELVPTYKPKVVPAGGKVVLYSLVGARDSSGNLAYYLGDSTGSGDTYPAAAIVYDREAAGEKRIALSKWENKKWGALKFQWGQIDARLQHRNLPHYNGADSPDYVWYTNVVPNGDKEGQWWKWDHPEYFETPLKNTKDRWWHYILPFLRKPQPWKFDPPAPDNGGTNRYKVQVTQSVNDQETVIESYGKFSQPFSSGGTLVDEDYYRGIREEVQRVTYLGNSNSDFLNGLLAYQGIPWLYGSAIVGEEFGHQTEKFIGFDCADLAMGAYRLAVDSSFKVKLGAHSLAQTKSRQRKYPWLDYAKRGTADNLGGKFSADVLVTPSGEALTIAIGDGEEEILPGDLVFFDWNKDGKWDHTTVFYKDGPRNPGVLSGDDIFIWANHSGVAVRELSALLHTDRTRMGIRYWPSK